MPVVSVRSVFEDCQGGMHGHAKLIKTLGKIYHAKKEDPTEDEEDDEMPGFLLKLFDFLLEHHGACDKAVRFRCCQIINKLLSNLGDDAQIDDDLYDRIYEGMLQRLKDKIPVVRQHAVLALSRLQDPTDNACPVIDAYIFLLGCDNNPEVRRSVLSCIAASTKTLPSILERTRDVKDLVRRLAYQSFFDLNLKVIAEKIHIKALTIAQRVRILNEGLNDRSDPVREACTGKLLQTWLLNFSGNILELLQSLDVENSMDMCRKMLKLLFKKSPSCDLLANFDLVDENLCIPIEKLNCESALYWRCLTEHLRGLGSEGEEFMEKIIPTLSQYCAYVQGIHNEMKKEENLEQRLQNEFVLQQLLYLANLFDHSDEVGRRKLKDLLRELLMSESITETLVPCIMAIFISVTAGQENRITEIVEIITEIKDPLTVVETVLDEVQQRKRDLKSNLTRPFLSHALIGGSRPMMADIRVELNQKKEELEECIQQQKFEEAAELKLKIAQLQAQKDLLAQEASRPSTQEVRETKNDPATLLKCLTVACELLRSLNMSTLSPFLQTMVESLVLPGVQSVDPAVRNAAVLALGLACLLSADSAKQHLLLFMQIVHMDQEAVQASALKVIFDLLLTFGLDNFKIDETDEAKEEGEEMPRTASSLLSILIALLNSESAELRTVCAEGFAKLMLSWRLCSQNLLSRLILLWYNPVTEDDTRLRHCLGTFFPLYAFAAKRNQDVVEEAFLPTLRTLWKASPTSPLAEVNANNVTDFLVQLTNKRLRLEAQKNRTIVDEESCCHDNLATRLCNLALERPESFHNRSIGRILNQLELSLDNGIVTRDLFILSQQMIQVIKDKPCLKYIEKFQASLPSSAKENCPLEGAVSSIATAQKDAECTEATLMDVSSAPTVASSLLDSSDDDMFASPALIRRGRNKSSARTPLKNDPKRIRANLTQQIEEESEKPVRRVTRNRQPLCDRNDD
ncbi:hypothetical protein CAPTEDRAFT_225765 [Capitella teleta]|uniref:UVR domain-containing protein n=1 Tax=Capitella teleta TaxID=283909 RepID=R7T6Y5_CAPTE|nr:hypothetical protein CAPTEDRAFT_225765 [Capitella teleta]|eukprot:ELT89300.1 hypothetical protein CAPTEDRAFT_225765 [Capitella teleta]